MTRWMHPAERDHAWERDDFDPATAGARLGLSREASLAAWERACAEATDGRGRLDADQARRRFHDLAARMRARGGRLGPDIGRLTRVEAEAAGPSAWGVEAVSRAPGRTSLVAAEVRSWRSRDTAPVLQARAKAGRVDEDPDELRRLAARAVAGGGERLPFLDLLQRAFGRHDLSSIKATTGGDAATAARVMGAEAFAYGERVVFADAPSLHTAAHEVAHVVQQRGGVDVDGGVGRDGDRYERHADEVADRVVRGESAADLLDAVAPTRSDASPVRAGTALQLRRIPPNVAALLRAIGSATADGANFAANADGVERLIALATSELTPAERTTVLHDRLGGLTEPAFNALPRRERLIRHANAIRTLVRAEPLGLGDPAQINVSPTDPAQVANLATVVGNADAEFARIAAGTANGEVDSVFGAANRSTALARYAAARTRMNNRHTNHAIVTDRSGYNEEVGLGGLTNQDRISIEAAVIDNPGLPSSITTLMHESMHAGNPGVVGDNGGYQDAAFLIAAPAIKLGNAAHYEVPVWRHLAPASANAFPNPHPPPAFREFVPPGAVPSGGGAPQPPPTTSEQAAIDASHRVQMAWTMGLNLHEVYQRLFTTPAAWTTPQPEFANMALDASVPYWSKVCKLTIHAKTTINPASADPALHPVSQIDMALSEGLTRKLFQSYNLLRVLLTEAQVQAFESANATAAELAAAFPGGHHTNVATERDLLVRLALRNAGIAPITGPIARDLAVVNEMATARTTGDWTVMLAPRNPASFAFP